MSQNTVIVARHAGLVEWLRLRGIEGEVISHVTDVAQVAGKNVVGVLPLNLAAEAITITSVDLPGLTAEQRGKELTVEEMDAAGANLQSYTVYRANLLLEPEEK